MHWLDIIASWRTCTMAHTPLGHKEGACAQLLLGIFDPDPLREGRAADSNPPTPELSNTPTPGRWGSVRCTPGLENPTVALMGAS